MRTNAVARGALFVASLGYPQCSGSHAILSTIVTLPGYASLCVADKHLTFLSFLFFFLLFLANSSLNIRFVLWVGVEMTSHVGQSFDVVTVSTLAANAETPNVCVLLSLSLFLLEGGGGDDGIGSRLFRIYVVFVSRGPFASKHLLVRSSFPTNSVTARLGAG